ncbi:50S ribosomal protein L31 [Coriobacteriaceae bacterium EMTCatB1]|nr:50S ribosomal protein L31 [Coriobacteriaceae bacterium EMTCatB1]
MRKGIHPDYVECRVVCSCGNTFVTRSTKPELHVELCNQCHPFYTGQQKFVDSGGRVQRFADKFGNAAAAVMEREAAEREARRKAAEEAAAKLKAEREAKAAEKASRAARFEVKQAVESGEAAADGSAEAAESAE